MTTPAHPRDAHIVALATSHAELFRPGFPEWLAANAHIWTAFERDANHIWRIGRRHYSARTIIEHLRHQSALKEACSEWKLNNNAAPDMARLYRLAHPARAELFELRAQGPRKVAA